MPQPAPIVEIDVSQLEQITSEVLCEAAGGAWTASNSTCTAAPATTTTAALVEEPVAVALPVERPTADTVDCRGNFRRGYRVRDDCVMEAITRTWTLAWAGDVEDMLSAVWYGHLLADALEARFEVERSDAYQEILRQDLEAGEGTPAQFAYQQERQHGLAMYDNVTVEVHGGHWHEPDDIAVRLRVLYKGEVVMPWIALGINYLDGKWQLPYRPVCQLWFMHVPSVSCPPDPRPDWKPNVGTILHYYSPVDDRENRT